MRPNSRRCLASERGSVASLIEILLVAAIILVLVWYLVGRANEKGETMPVAVKKRAVGVACQSNLRQVRQAITMYKDQNDDELPSSLSDLTDYGVGPGLTQCPVGKVPYVYDPATGTVHCPYPGHERY